MAHQIDQLPTYEGKLLAVRLLTVAQILTKNRPKQQYTGGESRKKVRKITMVK
jgi:hypothetical protein